MSLGIGDINPSRTFWPAIARKRVSYSGLLWEKVARLRSDQACIDKTSFYVRIGRLTDVAAIPLALNFIASGKFSCCAHKRCMGSGSDNLGVMAIRL